jgi:hypothetical protein
MNRATLRADYRIIMDELKREVEERERLRKLAEVEHEKFFSANSEKKLKYWSRRLKDSHAAIGALQRLGEALACVLEASERTAQAGLFEEARIINPKV